METRADGMLIQWDVPVEMPDGAVLAADVYRPDQPGRYPVILSHGVYAKGLPFNGDIYRMQWEKLVAKDPTVLEGSSNRYQSWEVTDPERWVPHGYAVVRVDSRGAGRSPGVLDPRSPQEYEDVCASVTWAGTQPWSTGKVAIMGISYYAVMAWAAAERNPEHLAAIVAWEGFNDPYRDAYYHGGILSEFTRRWQPNQIDPIQNGRGERAPVNPNTGLSVAGDVTLSDEELAANRVDVFAAIKEHPLFDAWHAAPPDRPVEDHHPVPHRGQLGRPGDPSPRQLQRLRRVTISRQVARGPRRHSLDPLLFVVRPRCPEAVPRPFPQGRGQRLGPHAPRPAQHPTPGRTVRMAGRERMAHRSDEMDPLSPPPRPDPSTRATRRRSGDPL